MSTTVDPFAALNTTTSTSGSSTSSSSSTTSSADRFLKLLVAQMQNQDPLNPMDNAEITSQMAQINTVTGVETLNTSVQQLSTQFMQMQALQGASLIGHDVTVAGNKVAIDGTEGTGGFDLTGTASNVKVEILDPSGRTVDTLQLGALEAGRHAFTWDASKATSDATYTFKVTASSGTATVPTTALMRDRVDAINTSGDTLTLELERSGSVAYSDIKGFD